MSGGVPCRCARIRKMDAWVVLQRCCNHSAFNGYRYTPSDYSEVVCTSCGSIWRTKAQYVSELPNGELAADGLHYKGIKKSRRLESVD